MFDTRVVDFFRSALSELVGRVCGRFALGFLWLVVGFCFSFRTIVPFLLASTPSSAEANWVCCFLMCWYNRAVADMPWKSIVVGVFF